MLPHLKLWGHGSLSLGPVVLAVGDFVLVSEAGGPRACLEESRVFWAVFKRGHLCRDSV